jgi:hypothetical protein
LDNSRKQKIQKTSALIIPKGLDGYTLGQERGRIQRLSGKTGKAIHDIGLLGGRFQGSGRRNG